MKMLSDINSIILLISSFLLACGSPSSNIRNPAENEDVRTEMNQTLVTACNEQNDRDACSMHGMSQWLAGRTAGKESMEAQESFVAACEKSGWFGCAMAGMEDDPNGEVKYPQRAFDLSTIACQQYDDAGACMFLGKWAEKVADMNTAKQAYAAACSLEVNPAKDREKQMMVFSCKKAMEFGVEDSSIVGKESALRPKRIVGETNIVPPRIPSGPTTAALSICVSKQGTPKKILFDRYSGMADWDQKIFETIRSWRFEVSPETKMSDSNCANYAVILQFGGPFQKSL